MKNNIQNLRFVIAYNTSGFAGSKKSVEEIIDICKASGFYGLEGDSTGIFLNKSLTELQKMGEQFKAAGLSINTFHLPYKDPVLDDIATLYETDRIKVEDRMKSWMEKAVAVGSTIGIVHPTTRKGFNVDIEGLDRICGQANKTIQTMLRFGEQFGFKIALENMLPYTGGRLGCKNEHMLKLYEENKHPNLGFCLDTGHSLVAHGVNAMSAYFAMKDHLIAFHLADNGGDRDSHLQPGKGNYFWKEFFTELNKEGFTGNVCVETPPFAFGPDYSKEAWVKMFAELNELVNKSLA
ncbi:MAG: sugar phosphate isomerase/epimerase [Spirochaetia bacterium]|nr:sugar phosphate isomerase/epimerase [Spirochaetia bacterium]